MIYMTGDTHGDIRRFNTSSFFEQKEMTKDDYVLTHCTSANTTALIGGSYYGQDILTQYLQEIKGKLDFKRWFFGHHHMDKQVNAEEICLFEQIIRVH